MVFGEVQKSNGHRILKYLSKTVEIIVFQGKKMANECSLMALDHASQVVGVGQQVLIRVKFTTISSAIA